MAPSTIFGQKNNRISIQTGLFHTFFDGSPMLNVNYQNKDTKPFHGLFYNSVGIQYTRTIHANSRISVEYMRYNEMYANASPNLLTNVLYRRETNTFNLHYTRILPLATKLEFTYGGGLNFRHGIESVVVNYYEFPNLEGHEVLLEPRQENDLGLNIRGGLEYSPFLWLTLYSTVDLVGFVYLHDKKAIQELQDFYGYTHYPHRFDLSWRFGIGFNF